MVPTGSISQQCPSASFTEATGDTHDLCPLPCPPPDCLKPEDISLHSFLDIRMPQAHPRLSGYGECLPRLYLQAGLGPSSASCHCMLRQCAVLPGRDGTHAQSSVVLLGIYVTVSMCFLQDKAWQVVMHLSSAQTLTTVPLWGRAPRILGRHPGLPGAGGQSYLLGSWEPLSTSEPLSGGLELFPEAKRTHVGRCGELVRGPEL